MFSQQTFFVSGSKVTGEANTLRWNPLVCVRGILISL